MTTTPSTSVHPLLPKLKSGAGNLVGGFGRHGAWDPRNQGELDRLAESLDVPRIPFEVNSIPDVWARPIHFHMALLDRDHVLHEQTRGEWRGLLAILGLKEILSFRELVVSEVRVSAVALPDFMKVLCRLKPREGLGGRAWYRNEGEDVVFPAVFVLKGKAIGMTSPTTVVCTATDCLDRVAGIHWSDGQRLKDPCSHLNRGHKDQLGQWLVHLKQRLLADQQSDKSKAVLNALLGEIDAFLVDLEVKSDVSAAAPAFAAAATSVSPWLPPPILPPADQARATHVRLEVSEGRAPGTEVLIADSRIAKQWNLEAHEVKVLGPATLAQHPFGGLPGDGLSYGSVDMPADMRARNGDYFFTDTLIVIRQGDALQGALKPQGMDTLRFHNSWLTPLLPIRGELLDYVSAEDLRDRMAFEGDDHGVRVTLKLRLNGPDDSGRYFEVQRRYDFGTSALKILESPPLIEVWPNFCAQGWKLYYAFYCSLDQQSTFHAIPVRQKGSAPPRPFRSAPSEYEAELTKLDKFPEAFSCTVRSNGLGSGTRETIDAGLILLAPPRRVNRGSEVWRVGVDFGTTSTNVWYATDQKDPAPLPATARYVSLATTSDVQRIHLYHAFLPAKTETPPFLSFYQQFHDQATTPPALEPLVDGHIYYMSPQEEVAELAKKRVKADLKWSEEPADRVRAQAFLRQVCIQAAAEAVDNGAREISLKYSYPTAFSEHQISGLPQTWRQILEACARETGVVFSTGEATGETESLACARYFAEAQHAPLAQGTVCIDIGGGTSDISIWQRDTMRAQASVRLAGREIFLDLLKKNPSFVAFFGGDQTILESLRNRRIDFYAQADAMIARAGDTWLKSLPTLTGDRVVRGFIQTMALGLGGIFYYVGLLMQHLVKQGRYSPQEPDVFLAGNGSKIVHWLASGDFQPGCPIAGLLTRCLGAASRLNGGGGSLKLRLSTNPKSEAACGLVGTRMLNIIDGTGLLAGEVHRQAGRERAWDSVLTAEDFKVGLEPSDKLVQLKDFLEVFDEFAGGPGANFDRIGHGELPEVKKRLADRLSELGKPHDVKEVHVEPVFILALKALLEIRGEKWASGALVSRPTRGR